jgi:UPF0042 nucleotide-binding protein
MSEFLILTGMSGAGKTQAEKVLEDIGYYCIDNMPAALIWQFAQIYTASPGKYDKVAFIIDIRGESEFSTLIPSVETLRKNSFPAKIIFLEAQEAALHNRYKETRRAHPLSRHRQISLTDAIAMERELIEPLRLMADYRIDTTTLTVAQLRDKLQQILLITEEERLAINCVSFGFKYGILEDADLVFDVRCFPNPYWEESLRALTGLDERIDSYVFAAHESNEFFTKLCEMMLLLIPLYLNEGKTQLTIGIGCTGGKHRSVAFTERLRTYLCKSGYNAIALHRDIIKKSEIDR